MSPLSCCGIWRRCRNERRPKRLNENESDPRSRTADGQARPQATPYASNYDMWTEALEYLKKSEGRKNIVSIVESWTRELDNSLNKKSLAVEIQKKMDEALEGHNYNSKTRNRIRKAVISLDKIISVGDVAVSIDPVHAAPAWAAFRTIVKFATAYVELGNKLLGETAKAVSLLVRCDTYQELFMAQDPALCPPEVTLDRLKTSIVQVYAQSQLLLGFTIKYHQYHQSKVKILRAPLNIISAPWKLEGLKDLADKLSENKSQLLEVADDCEKHCALLNRPNFQKLLKIDKDLGTMNSNLVSALEQLDEDKRVRILEWISPILSHEHHDTIKEVRMAGTCEWLIQNERFREWRDTSSSAILWLHSSPGFGKTFLTSKVIDHMQSFLESSPNQEGFAFFYCNRTGEGSQKLHHILRSFVRQLSTTVRNPGQIRKRLQNVFSEESQKRSSLSLDICKEQLLESVNLYQKTTLVLDALDICERNTVLGLFRVIDDLLAKSERPLKVFISSRPNYEIRAHFASQPKIEIRAIDNESDIKIFVKNEINKPEISTSLKNDIDRVIVQRSNGMFQWAYLQIKQVCDLTTEQDIRARLGKLPTGLKEVYDEIYNEIAKSAHGKTLVDRACMWVMSADRPLQSTELLSAIQVELDQDTEVTGKITESHLLSLCKNLLVLDSQQNLWMFSHHSVREYLQDNHWNLGQAHCYAAQVCLKTLIVTYKSPIGESEVKNLDDKCSSELHISNLEHPFQVYLRYYWIFHVRAYDKQVTTGVEIDLMLAHLLKTFLGSLTKSSIQYEKWYYQMDFKEKKFFDVDIENIFPNVPAFIMCCFSVHALLADWWDSIEIDLSRMNRHDQNLLFLAANAGSRLICQSLIKRQLPMNFLQDPNYGHTLIIAAYSGWTEIIKSLIQLGVDVNIQLPFRFYGNALSVAAYARQTKTVKFLVQLGAEINTPLQSGKFGSTLVAAVVARKTEIVEFLLQKGADINMLLQTGDHGSALAAAATLGQTKMVKFLVQQGADVNMPLQGRNYNSTLAATVAAGHTEIIEFLIQKGAR